MSEESPANVIEELLGAHELCRRFDFLPDDIFVLVQGGYVSIVLHGDEDREFTVGVSAVSAEDLIDFGMKWTNAARAWNKTMTNNERIRIYKGSRAYAEWRTLLVNMRQAGFRPKGGWSPEIEALSMAIAPGARAPEFITSKKSTVVN